MPRVVLDTNVLISAIVGHGTPRRLVLELLKHQVVITSRELLAELLDVVAREKFRDIEKNQINSFVAIVASKSLIVKLKGQPDIVKDDPDDNVVLASAKEGKADYIVSGDQHLLDLKQFRGIKILSVKEMLEVIRFFEDK
ncbi:MAG: putative toxin-antitoxin system toxin component, PIN family [Thaumarchaeota archaeon]|nr:putative toxin-antitoxin system toxin component, PIN family [Nitrososphaerota archaeon]